ncbi:MAG: HTTM domain-containing protein [Vulcanimicrobiota bacterium]
MKRLESWLFSPESAYPYAVIRIGVGLVAFLHLLFYAPYVVFFFSDEGFLPSRQLPVLVPEGWPLYFFWLARSAAAVWCVYGLTLAASLAYAAGFKTRLTGPLLWLLLLSFIHRNVFVIDGIWNLLVAILTPLMLVDSGGVLSWDARGRKQAATIDSWVGVVLRFQLGVTYVKSGFYKLMGSYWVKGTSLYYVLENPQWRRFDYGFWLDQGWVVAILAVVTVVTVWWELFFPLLVAIRPWRYYVLGFGVFLHGSQFITIDTSVFSLLLMTLYVAFLPPERVKEAARKLASRTRSAD